MIPQVCSRIALGLAYRRSARPASQFVVSTIPSSSLDGVRFHSSKSPSSSMQKKALAVLRNHRKSDDSSTESEISTTETIAKGGPSSPIQTLNNDFNNEANTAAAATDVPSKAKNDTNTNTQKSETKIEATPSPDAKLAPPPQQELKPRLDSHFLHEFAPKIVVVGVGGAGGNALNNMVAKELKGVDFLALNTDAQHLSSMLTDQRLQLGIHLTNGLGCGANPDAGRMAAEESREQIQEQLKDAHLVFITAGMGGGTGTGAAPVVADICYEMGILTVGVVTLPFSFEGTHRRRLALEGVERLQSVVDTLIVIPNQNLFQIAGPETTFVDAFQMADDVLLGGVKSITDLMTSPGLINLDFADVQVRTNFIHLRLKPIIVCRLDHKIHSVQILTPVISFF